MQTISVHNNPVELYVPDEGAVRKAYEAGEIAAPFWSRIWPAAIALSEFLICHPHYIKNKSVLEVGAGLGLPSLVAARYATAVLCTDSSADAVAIIAQSAAHGGLQNLATAVVDWQHPPSGLAADVLLLSDLNYEPDSFAGLQKFIAGFLQKNATIIISTPQRLLAKPFVAALLPDCIYQEERSIYFNETTASISILVLKKGDAEIDS